jgi:hypothetical protein
MNTWILVKVLVALTCVAIVVVLVKFFMGLAGRQVTKSDKAKGFDLVGPWFPLIERDLRKRDYVLTRTEKYGIWVLVGVLAFILTGAVLFG